MPGEVFGEADVILRVRLDQLQQQLDQGERMTVESASRMQQVQRQTAASVRVAAQEAENGVGIIGRLGQAYGAWKLLGGAVKAGGVAISAIPAIALAAKAALVGLAVGGILLVGNAFDRMIASVEQGAKAFRDTVAAARGLDGTTGSVLELAQALERIPIVGGAAGTAFRVFSGDAEVSDRALMSLVASVEDGEVKIGRFKRFLAGGVGLGSLVRDIDKANEKLQEFNRLNEQAAGRGQRTATSGAGFDSATESSGDAARLSGLQGVERIRAENEISHREAMRQIDEQKQAHLSALDAEMRKIQRQRDAEEIDASEARTQLQRFASERQQLEKHYGETVAESSKNLKAAGEARIQQEIKLAAAQDRRLAATAQAATLEAAGNTLGAQMVMIAYREQEAITAAQESGQDHRIASIRQYYAAQRQIAQDAANQQAQAEGEAQQRRIMQMEDALDRERQIEQRRRQSVAERTEDVQSDIRAQTLRSQGDEFGARREEILGGFRSQIEDAIQSGDMAFLKALQELRDLRLEALKAEEREFDMQEAERAARDAERNMRSGSNAQARQVDTALGFLTGGDDKREEKQAVDELKKIAKNTKNPVAVAG